MEEMKDQNQQTIIIQQQPAPSNGLGIAGFVLSLVALFLGWVPVVGWLLWLVGLLLSFCGVFKSPRGFAIAGLLISLLDFMLVLMVFGAVATLLALS